jgi:hypothetical protein
MSQGPFPIVCYQAVGGLAVGASTEIIMGKSPQFTDVKAAAYTARAPSWLRELTRSVAMAMGWLIASAIVVLIVGFVISALI